MLFGLVMCLAFKKLSNNEWTRQVFAGFYSKDFILEMFSMGYVNIFGFFVVVVCVYNFNSYYFHLFYFVLCGDFNFVPSYSIVETGYTWAIPK
jgi:hypothetical protein